MTKTVSQTYLTGPQVQARYQRSHVSLWRWAKDPELGFPKPMQIKGLNYWKLADLEAWEAAQPSFDQLRTDAHLIAAAPELLSGHHTILAMLGNVDHSQGGGHNTAKMYGEMLEDIRKVSEQAIAKATGQ